MFASAFLKSYLKNQDYTYGRFTIARRIREISSASLCRGYAEGQTAGEKRKNIQNIFEKTSENSSFPTPLSFLFHYPHSRFFTKLRSKKYTQGKLFSEFSKTFFVPNPRFLSFSKLFSVQMQTASYLFTVKKHEKRTTCTTRNSKRPPSFGHISHAKKELKKIFKIFEKISKKGLTF